MAELTLEVLRRRETHFLTCSLESLDSARNPVVVDAVDESSRVLLQGQLYPAFLNQLVASRPMKCNTNPLACPFAS
jgi:hypothetical protein